MTAPTYPWTDEQLAELAKRWKAGERVSYIAKFLGCTRSMVIAKAHRLGLRPHPDQHCNPAVLSSKDAERRGGHIGQNTVRLRRMDEAQRQALIKLARIGFQDRRLPGEPNEGRWK